MCGDALGAPIEFKSPAALAEHYPQGVHGMVQGWGSTARLVPGEITDDSEMAIALLESLVREGGFSPNACSPPTGNGLPPTQRMWA